MSCRILSSQVNKWVVEIFFLGSIGGFQEDPVLSSLISWLGSWCQATSLSPAMAGYEGLPTCP